MGDELSALLLLFFGTQFVYQLFIYIKYICQAFYLRADSSHGKNMTTATRRILKVLLASIRLAMRCILSDSGRVRSIDQANMSFNLVRPKRSKNSGYALCV
jgi:hypothetical protein